MHTQLIYKYIAKKFWGPFCFALGVFAVLVMLGDTFEKMKNLSNGIATIWDVLTYSMLTFPNWLTTIMPVACLLGAISVISEMVSNGEWTACIAGGFSPRQLFKPVVACILTVVALTMLMQEFVVPPLLSKADIVYYTRLKPVPNYNQSLEPNVIIKVAPTQMLFAKTVDLENGIMQRVSLDTYNKEWDIAQQIVANQMVWNEEENSWLFVDGLLRTFTGPTNTSEERFDSKDAPLSIRPDEMSISQVEEKLMSIRDLTKRISFHKQTGLSSYSAETIRQSKFATPFVTVIMCLLGMPFAISSRRKSKILNIIASMVIAFAFWSLISMCTAIGVNGYVNPFVAGWGPVVFFSAVVFFEFKWMRL